MAMTNTEKREHLRGMINSMTYGVEIEMTGITREKAAALCASLVGGSVQYVGGAYHKYTVTEFVGGRVWQFVSDCSINAVDSNGRTAAINYIKILHLSKPP